MTIPLKSPELSGPLVWALRYDVPARPGALLSNRNTALFHWIVLPRSGRLCEKICIRFRSVFCLYLVVLGALFDLSYHFFILRFFAHRKYMCCSELANKGHTHLKNQTINIHRVMLGPRPLQAHTNYTWNTKR